MDVFLKFLLDSLRTGGVLIPVAVVFVAVVFHAGQIHEFVTTLRRSREETIKRFLALENLSAEVRAVLADHLDAIAFREATGIQAEKSLREGLIQLHGESNGEVSWRELRMARPYLTPDLGRVQVKLGVLDYLSYGLTMLGALVLALFALAMMLGPMVGDPSLGQILASYGLALVFGAVAFVMYAAELPFHFARRFRKHLAKARSAECPSTPAEPAALGAAEPSEVPQTPPGPGKSV
jgi:hypothetical protein